MAGGHDCVVHRLRRSTCWRFVERPFWSSMISSFQDLRQDLQSGDSFFATRDEPEIEAAKTICYCSNRCGRSSIASACIIVRHLSKAAQVPRQG
jgi:hypothetical protein